MLKPLYANYLSLKFPPTGSNFKDILLGNLGMEIIRAANLIESMHNLSSNKVSRHIFKQNQCIYYQ